MFFDFNEISTLAEHVSSAKDSIHNIHNNNLHELANLDVQAPATTPSPKMNAGARAGAYIGAGLAMTGALGVGIGQGYVGGKAALATAKNPDEYSRIRAMMLIGAAIAESSAIYALIIAILLIFVAPSLGN